MSDPQSALPAIIAHMVDGLVTTSETGLIDSVNPAASRMFGCSIEELRGHPFTRLLETPAPGPDAVIGAVPPDVLGHVTTSIGRRADGATFPLELTVYEFQTDHGRRFAVNLRDVSERQEVDRMKDEFVSVVSHELRTPLTSIRGALQIVLGERPDFADPEHEPLLQIALSNCERLIRIINDILDVSKIESGKMELHPLDCDVAQLIETAIQSVAEMPKAAGVTMVRDVAPGIPAVLADADRLVQVLVNLLSNAVKFSPPSTTITVSAHQEGQEIVLQVRDQGRGIKPENLRRLFQKFQQVDSSPTRRAGGTGLGLAIVKALVESHRGRVTVESIVDVGTTFTVRLSCGAASPAAPAPSLPETSLLTPPEGSRTVLVVDDDADVRQVIRKQLEKFGYRVTEAADGTEALARARSERPHLVTMDLIMPGIGGLAAIRELAADPETASIPIVIVSALVDQTGLSQDRSAVAKPFSTDALHRAVTQALRNAKARPTVLLAEDDADLREVLTQALTRMGLTVLAAADGDAACRLFDETPCDLVLLDLTMPVIDGFQLISHMRQADRPVPVPIIAISGLAGAAAGQRSVELGANLFLPKPVDTSALSSEINRLLARR